MIPSPPTAVASIDSGTMPIVDNSPNIRPSAGSQSMRNQTGRPAPVPWRFGAESGAEGERVTRVGRVQMHVAPDDTMRILARIGRVSGQHE